MFVYKNINSGILKLMEIAYYQTKSGRYPVKDFIDDLTKQDKAKVLGCLITVEQNGLAADRVEFRQIERKLWEIKIRGVDGSYRIFYVTVQSGKEMVLLHGYKKQSQKAPLHEIETAKKRMKEVLK
jgi:phage-related protein